jgi:hypothetical protein
VRFDYCEGLKISSHDSRIQCPPNIEYPTPPRKIEVLFIGWNPPGAKHFWNSQDDNLFADLTWVFGELGWSCKRDLWEVFRERDFYLVHAVKCWQRAKFLWNIPGLVDTCARNLLVKNIEDLSPKTICALGKLPHKALSSIWPSEIPRELRYGKGWCETVHGRKVIITAFPNWHWNKAEKKTNRECTALALKRWVS